MKKIVLILFMFIFVFGKNCDNKLFSLSTEGNNGINLQDVITDLSDTCNLNIVIKDDLAKLKLKKELKYLKLKNLTLDEFLKYLLDRNNFFYSLKNNVLEISYVKTKNFKIDYINSIITGNTNFSASTQDTNGGTNTLNSQFTFDFWKEFNDNIKKILDFNDYNYFEMKPDASVDEEKSFITVSGDLDDLKRVEKILVAPEPIIDKSTGIVTVTGTKSQLDRIEKYIDELNKRLHKEVLIDVKIYSVKLSNSNQIGINWSNFNISFGGTSAISTPLTSANLVGSSSIFREGTFNIQGLLNFLSSYGQVNSISNPKITTLNNQKAIITVGQTVNYSYKQVTTDANGNAVQSDVIDSKFIGILLDITPEISDKGVILMGINPSISSIAPTELKDNLPPDTYEKKLNTIIRVKDGDTIILGGLITDETTFVQNGVPVLKEIPVLKYLFSSKSKISNREELIFVITPHIINLNKSINMKKVMALPKLGEF